MSFVLSYFPLGGAFFLAILINWILTEIWDCISSSGPSGPFIEEHSECIIPIGMDDSELSFSGSPYFQSIQQRLNANFEQVLSIVASLRHAHYPSLANLSDSFRVSQIVVFSSSGMMKFRDLSRK